MTKSNVNAPFVLGLLGATMLAIAIGAMAAGSVYLWNAAKMGPTAPGNPDPAIAYCEAAVKSSLKSPTSYKQISSFISGTTAYVTYDAANSFNVLLRDTRSCVFGYLNGNFILMSFNISDNGDEAIIVRARLIAEGLYAIRASDTRLQPSRDERAATSCVSAIVNLVGAAEWPPRSQIIINGTGLDGDQPFVGVIFKAGTSKVFPIHAKCAGPNYTSITEFYPHKQ